MLTKHYMSFFSFLYLLVNVSLFKTYILGDSQACGASAYAPKDWITVCKVGSTVGQWNSRIDSIPLSKGDNVIVFLGSNDWYATPNVVPLLTKLRTKQVHCVFVGPPLIRGQDGSAQYLKSSVEKDGTCKYLDSRTLHLRQPDGVHTSEYKKWLNSAVDALNVE